MRMTITERAAAIRKDLLNKTLDRNTSKNTLSTYEKETLTYTITDYNINALHKYSPPALTSKEKEESVSPYKDAWDEYEEDPELNELVAWYKKQQLADPYIDNFISFMASDAVKPIMGSVERKAKRWHLKKALKVTKKFVEQHTSMTGKVPLRTLDLMSRKGLYER
jgi:hypothetical protein